MLEIVLLTKNESNSLNANLHGETVVSLIAFQTLPYQIYTLDKVGSAFDALLVRKHIGTRYCIGNE